MLVKWHWTVSSLSWITLKPLLECRDPYNDDMHQTHAYLNHEQIKGDMNSFTILWKQHSTYLFGINISTSQSEPNVDTTWKTNSSLQSVVCMCVMWTYRCALTTHPLNQTKPVILCYLLHSQSPCQRTSQGSRSENPINSIQCKRKLQHGALSPK